MEEVSVVAVRTKTKAGRSTGIDVIPPAKVLHHKGSPRGYWPVVHDVAQE